VFSPNIKKTIKSIMPGFELIGCEEKKALVELFDEDKNNGILFEHAFGDLRNGCYQVREFENEFGEKFGVKYTHCCASGTFALKIALKAVGICHGDEVITQPFNFIAGPEAIVDCGGIVKLVNIDESLNMCPIDLEKKITHKTKAILVVHMLGVSADLSKILQIGKKYNIPVIEDAAEILGGKYDEKYLGTLADIGIYSLDFAKTITAGEGGIIVTNNSIYSKFIKEYVDHGHENNPKFSRGLDTVSIPGFNARMTEMQGALGKVQLKKLDYIVEENRIRYNILYTELNDKLKIRHIFDENIDTLYDTFMFEIDDKELMSKLVKFLAKNIGIKNMPTAINWHCTSYWGHIINDSEIKYTTKSHNTLLKYIAIPILLKRTPEDYLFIASELKKIID
jgi:8-amino-3,8-dideoxy-alpha-D-manno-octulosonate transaminase